MVEQQTRSLAECNFLFYRVDLAWLSCGSEMLGQSANQFCASDSDMDMSATALRGRESYSLYDGSCDCDIYEVLQVRS